MLHYKSLLVLSIAALLTSCGGGGDSPTQISVSGPLSKYVGNYSSCDNHQKAAVAISTVSANQISIKQSRDIYDNSNCTGSVIGTLTVSSSLTLTYQDTAVATVSGIGSGLQILTIDKVKIYLPPSTQSLTGSGVRGLCVYYANGNTCFNSLAPVEINIDGGLYLSGNSLATITNRSGIYYADDTLLTKIN